MAAIERLGLAVGKSDATVSGAQKQTDEAFRFKRAKRDTHKSDASKANIRRWLMERHCDNGPSCLFGWLGAEDQS